MLEENINNRSLFLPIVMIIVCDTCMYINVVIDNFYVNVA